MALPVIALTMGDPAGIGPEICLRALADPAVRACCIPILFGDLDLLLRVHRAAGVPEPPDFVSLPEWKWAPRPDHPLLVDCGVIGPAAIEPGRVNKTCGGAAYTYVEHAVRAVQSGRADAIATAPLHKEALNLAGILYPGHTEILAALTGTEDYCMMMASDELIVSLATIHVGIRELAGELTASRVLRAIRLTHTALLRLGKPRPRITVCGLNPHAGEGGLFGNDERERIDPALAAARHDGIDVEGPLPADTAFVPAVRARTDAYIAMYHDQGLIPFKMLAFEEGVNVTLGLPFVRTSVDHGTAFDLAWQGKATPHSMISAIRWAVRLSGAAAPRPVAG